MEKERRLIKVRPEVHQQLLDMANKRDVAVGDIIENLLRLQRGLDFESAVAGHLWKDWRFKRVIATLMGYLEGQLVDREKIKNIERAIDEGYVGSRMAAKK